MIPRRVHHYWHDQNLAGLPDAHRDAQQAWVDLHPDWEHFVWTDANLPPLLNQTMYDNPARWHHPNRLNQLKANVVRFEVLYRMGGVWSDWDVQPLRSFDRFLTREAFIGQSGPGSISTAVIGAEPNHPWALDAISELGNLTPAGIWMCTSVAAATRALKTHPEVTVFDRKWFQPVDHLGQAHADIRKSYAVNLWARTQTYTLEET